MTIATTPAAGAAARHPRSTLRSVAVPGEHGGWGLTGEPVLLGLAVAPSVAGVCIGIAAVLAFTARTPLKVVLVDRHRNRDLDRTALARRVLIVEAALIAALIAVAAATTTDPFWWPVAVAAPLVVVELWFDTRSRSRRLVPELAGTYGICAVAAMILLAGGRPSALAVAVWLVLAARATTAIPHVRDRVGRLHGRPSSPAILLAADGLALVAAATAVIVEPAVAAGTGSVVAVVAFQRLTAHRAAPAKVIGIQQTILGLAVVVSTAVGIHLT